MTQIFDPEAQPFFELAQEINRRCLSENLDKQGLAQWIMQAAGKLGASIPDNSMMEWQESFDYFNSIMEQRQIEAQKPLSERRDMRWAWTSWNTLLDPAEGGMLAVVSAPDGAGKTAFAEQQAESWAKQGFNVVFLHYELSKSVMTDRRASRHAGITRRTLREGRISDGQQERLHRSEQQMRDYPGEILYIHSPGWTPERTTQVLHSLHAEGKCDVVVLDYLEKIKASDSQIRQFGNNHFVRESDTVEQLKNFAEQHDIPVLMLAQFSKAGKVTSFENLTRGDIRGAGEKTEKANMVILLHRERNEEGVYGNVVKVKIDKNTLGATGTLEQYFDGRYFRIIDFTEQAAAEDEQTLPPSAREPANYQLDLTG